MGLIKSLVRAPIKLSAKGLEAGPHITRYFMYNKLAALLKDVDKSGLGTSILSVSHSERLCGLLDVENQTVTRADYPEYNILELPFQDDHFDFVVSDQVLEHVEGSPQKAIDETYRVLKPGGIAVHTTCFINHVHAEPKDFWRFTPDALRFLCKDFSEVVDAGGWGNRWVWFIDWLGMRFDPVPHAQWHPLHKIAVRNDEKWPIVTWIVARK